MTRHHAHYNAVYKTWVCESNELFRGQVMVDMLRKAVWETNRGEELTWWYNPLDVRVSCTCRPNDKPTHGIVWKEVTDASI